MQKCCYCHKELDSSAKVCPYCGKTCTSGRPIYTFPSVIIAFLGCCVICYFYLQRYAGTPGWLSVVLAFTIVFLLFAGLLKLGQFCG